MDADRNLFLVYRNSVKTSPSSWDKDTFLMVSRDAGETWSKRLIEKWENCGCPGAPYSMATSDDGVFFGYSTRGTSSFARVADNLKPVSVPDSGKPATRPNVATNGKGQVLLAWTEAQDVLWQVYDKGGQPIEGCLGRLEKVAARWSNPAVVATQAGDFLLYYDSQNTINKPGA